jgi:hypothetical protein
VLLWTHPSHRVTLVLPWTYPSHRSTPVGIVLLHCIDLQYSLYFCTYTLAMQSMVSAFIQHPSTYPSRYIILSGSLPLPSSTRHADNFVQTCDAQTSIQDVQQADSPQSSHSVMAVHWSKQLLEAFSVWILEDSGTGSGDGLGICTRWMNFLHYLIHKSKLGNWLSKNLELVCAFKLQDFFTLETFPYNAAYGSWRDETKWQCDTN